MILAHDGICFCQLFKTGVGVEKRAPERDTVSVVSIAVYRSSSSEGYN